MLLFVFSWVSIDCIKGYHINWFHNPATYHKHFAHWFLYKHDYKKSLKVNPQDASVYYNLGIIYDEICEYNLSVKYYKSAINIDPNFNDTYFNLATVFERLEKFESSLKYYILANKKNPRDKKKYT